MQTPAAYVVDKPASAVAVVLMQCPLAGFKFYAAETHWRQLRARDPLALVREPGNRHDPRAVRIEWQGVILGYVPREANYTVSQMLDRGQVMAGRIASLQESADPWKRVMVEIEWLGDGARAAPVRRPSNHTLDDLEIVDLGSFATGAPPSKIDFARAVENLGEEQRRVGAIALARSSADIIGRLAMPVTGVVASASRSVQLWGLLEIVSSLDGRTLSARGLDSKREPSISANLATPISNAAWTAPFEHIVDRATPDVDFGVIIASLPEHWLERTMRRTFQGFVDFATMRRTIVDFLALDELTLSLANRIFDNAPTAEQFNWCGRHRDALCLAAIEHPALLPFLRWAGDWSNPDPMAAVWARLAMEGLDAAAAKRLERWGYEPFAALAHELAGDESIDVLVAFANMLARVGVMDRPPIFFSHCAGAAANWFHRGDGDAIFGTSLPDWFMRAMLRAVEAMDDEEDEIAFGQQLVAAMPWIASVPLEPDSNQCKAGWPWIMERVREFESRQAKGEWPAVLDECVIWGYHVVPIHTMAQLKSEARHMKNCLENYADQCKAGAMAIFSIRTPGIAGGKRVADVTVIREVEHGRATWSLDQLASKMNSPAPADVEAVARRIVDALNSCARD